MSLTGLELIKAYRAEPEKYYPLKDHTEEVPDRTEYGDINLGWNAGLLDGNRPYFAECWAWEGMTLLTVFIPAEGIEYKTGQEIEEWLLETGYYSYRSEDHDPAEVRKCTDPEGKEFFSVCILVGRDDEPAMVDGAPLRPWEELNEYNRMTMH